MYGDILQVDAKVGITVSLIGACGRQTFKPDMKWARLVGLAESLVCTKSAAVAIICKGCSDTDIPKEIRTE